MKDLFVMSLPRKQFRHWRIASLNPSTGSFALYYTGKTCKGNDISLTTPEIGVRIRLLNEETKKYCVKGERDILSKYEDIRSDSTLQLRDQLHKVRTSNGLLVSIDVMKRI